MGQEGLRFVVFGATGAVGAATVRALLGNAGQELAHPIQVRVSRPSDRDRTRPETSPSVCDDAHHSPGRVYSWQAASGRRRGPSPPPTRSSDPRRHGQRPRHHQTTPGKCRHRDHRPRDNPERRRGRCCVQEGRRRIRRCSGQALQGQRCVSVPGLVLDSTDRRSLAHSLTRSLAHSLTRQAYGRWDSSARRAPTRTSGRTT